MLALFYFLNLLDRSRYLVSIDHEVLVLAALCTNHIHYNLVDWVLVCSTFIMAKVEPFLELLTSLTDPPPGSSYFQDNTILWSCHILASRQLYLWFWKSTCIIFASDICMEKSTCSFDFLVHFFVILSNIPESLPGQFCWYSRSAHRLFNNDYDYLRFGEWLHNS